MKAVTIAARHVMPRVRVLASTFRRAHPDADFVALLVDALPTDADPGEDFETVGPWVLGLLDDDFARLSFMYTEDELVAALKPWALQWVLTTGHDVAIYLDPDMVVYDSLDGLATAARAGGIALTPQRLTPVPADGLRPSEAEMMATGIHSLGCVAVTDAAIPWLRFWAERLRTDAAPDATSSPGGDQRWADWVPALFECERVADPGIGVGYWNLDERGLERVGEHYRCQGHPLRTFAFPGYDPAHPWTLSAATADAPRVVISEHPALAPLLAEYDALVRAAETLGPPASYRYASFADGTAITPRLRRFYRSELGAARGIAPRATTPVPPVPDYRAGFENVAAWLCEPSSRMPLLTRWAYAVWSSRSDLQGAFPDPQDAHRDGFSSWLETHGVSEGYVDPAWTAATRPLRPASRQLVREPGCHVFGYFSSVLGVGATARAVVRALERAAIPMEILGSDQTQSPKEIDFAETRTDVRYPINVVAVNADLFPLWVERYGTEFAPDAHTIGLWAWELDELPGRMADSFAHVDEIWAFSDFNAEAFRRASGLPVHVFPVPAIASPPQPRPDLSDVDLRNGYFLFMFDYLSEAERKNPLGLIAAYLQAFPTGEGPALVIKSLNGEQRRTERERVRRAASASDHIVLIERYLPADQIDGLIQHALAFVSLHRSEGLGLGLMEAMAQGTPVVATAYSGNLTFMDAENSILLPYRLVDTTEAAGCYTGLGQWAEPDLGAAAAALRRLAEDPTFARTLGRRGQQDITSRFSTDRAAAFVRGRVDDIVAGLPESSGSTARRLTARLRGALRRR